MPFFKAVIAGDEFAIKILVQSSADSINNRNEKGQTPLHVATLNGDPRIVAALLAGKPDVNAIDNQKNTALINAATEGNADVVDMILKNGANKNDRDDMGKTALIKATINGRFDVVDRLLKHRANIDDGDNDGITALMYAAMMDHSDIVDLLLNAGANKHIGDRFGTTALMHAAINGNANVVDLLLHAGVNKNVVDQTGSTALELATANDHIDVIIRLIRHQGFQQRLVGIIGRSSVPDRLKCPLSKQVMNEPVAASDGVVYDRESLFQLFQATTDTTVVSPITKATLSNEVLRFSTSIHVKQDIEAFVAEQVEADSMTTLAATHGIFNLDKHQHRPMKTTCSDVFNRLKCPISLELMADPVATPDGFIYERASLSQLFQTSANSTAISPMTRMKLSEEVLNFATSKYVKEDIDAFAAENEKQRMIWPL